MWNYLKRNMITQQPFRMLKTMTAIAAGEASISTVFFVPTSGYRILDAVLKPFFILLNFGVRACFIFGPLVFIAYLFIAARSFDEISEGSYGLITIAANTGVYFNIHATRPLLLQMVEKFENLMEACVKNRPKLAEHYRKAAKLVEEWTLIIALAFFVSVAAITAPYFDGSYILYYFTDRKEDAFQLPFEIGIPWNWRTPFGFLVASGMEFVPIAYISLFCACNMALQVVTCRLMVAFVYDAKTQWGELDERNKRKGGRGNRIEILKRFQNCAELYTFSKEFASDLSEVQYYYYFIHFVWTLLTVCISLLMLQTELLKDHPNSSSLLKHATFTFTSIVQIFVYCDASERVNDEFEEIDVYTNTDWYEFPREIQRMLPVLIGAHKQPLEFAGFGGIPCTRETFKTVANTGFSYFMTLRQFRT